MASDPMTEAEATIAELRELLAEYQRVPTSGPKRRLMYALVNAAPALLDRLEHAASDVQQLSAQLLVEQERRAIAESRVERAEAMIKKWLVEQAEYPATSEGQYAAAGVRCCADELDQALKGEPDGK